MTFRTQVFEPLAIAALAWLLPGQATPNWLGHASRYLLIVSFIVFGVDHFLALAPIGTLIPPWIPWHVFWIAFFGTGFVAAGLSLAFNFLPDWGAASIGLMYAIWVCHPSPSQNNSWALRGKRPARSRRVVESVHRHGSVGRFMGSGFEWSSSGSAENLKCRARWISWY
jgi:hypothetical protein